MKKIILYILVFCLPAIYASAQKNISMVIYAGSNAPWGKNQTLTINAKGDCKYVLTEVHKGIIDSSDFTISQTQLNELYDAVQQVHFFKLDKIYNSGDVDGSRIYIQVNLSGKSHAVELINKQVKEVTTLVNKLNTVISSHNVHINY